MKITMIGPFPPFRGGISDFNYSLSRELSKAQEVQLINFTTQYPRLLFPGKTQFRSDFDDKFKSQRILSSVNPLSWNKTVNKICNFNPDLIIFQYWMPFFTFAYNYIIERVKKQINTEIIAICHNLTPHEDKSFYKSLTKRYLRKVDKFVVMSEVVQSDLENFKPEAVYKKLFHPLYELFGSELDKQTAQDSLRLKNKNIILFFGLIREYKGLDLLLKSIPLFAHIVKDFQVIIAGECYENPNKYLKIVEALNIEEYVKWDMEFVPDEAVNLYFSAADLVVLPYRSATQSGITKIAYNFNRPVIISDVGGLSEIVENGKTGYIVKPDKQELADAIIAFFNGNKFQEFSNNVKQFKGQYSWNTFAAQLLEFSRE